MIRDAVAARLEAAADERTRDWWERYLRGAIPFRGVKMADIRAIVHDVWPPDAPVDLALAQFEQPFSEDKIAGVLALAEINMPRLSAADVPRLAEPFERGLIADWSTCDWYCVKVLGKLIERDPAAAPPIAAWRDAEDLWQRRAAAVAFVDLVPRGLHHDLVLEVLERNVLDPARFSQRSVGWVLRELGRADPERAQAFLARHGGRMSAEARRQAQTKRSSARSSSRASP